MSLDFLSRRRKITLTLAFILAWPAAWLTDFVGPWTRWIPVYEGQAQRDDQGNWLVVRLPVSRSPDHHRGTIQLSVVTESSGWPFTATIYQSNTVLMPGEIWGAHRLLGGSRLIERLGDDDAPLEQSILDSGDQRAIDALLGILPPPGPRLLGWIGNVIVWWGLCYLGIFLTLVLAHGIDRAPHIPRVVLEEDRISRGVCPGCAYDVRGLGEEACCPECGRTVSAEARGIALGHPIVPPATDDEATTKLSS